MRLIRHIPAENFGLTSVFRRIRTISPGAYSVVRGEMALASRRQDQTWLDPEVFGGIRSMILSVRRFAQRARNPRIAITMLLASVAVLPAAMHAQVGTATVSGTIQDATGSIIAGAAVTLKNDANGDARTQKSDGSGFFSFQNLPASTYDLSVSASGFAGLERRNIVLHIGDSLSVPALRLAIASVQQTATVEAESDSI